MSAKQFPAALNAKEEDVQKLLACGTHLGTKNLEPAMGRYVWRRRANDGIHIINLQKTWEKIVLAARVIVAIENPADVVLVSGRPYSQRAILKTARYTGVVAVAGRYTPGTFTNQSQENFVEPRLLVVSDPRLDRQSIIEASKMNVPVIAFCNTDSSLQNVDIAIPCNNKGKHSIGLLWWLLCREILYLKNVIPRGQPWEVMTDLFFYRDPQEEEKDQKEEVPRIEGEEVPHEYAEQETEVAEPVGWDKPATKSTWDQDQ